MYADIASILTYDVHGLCHRSQTNELKYWMFFEIRNLQFIYGAGLLSLTETLKIIGVYYVLVLICVSLS